MSTYNAVSIAAAIQKSKKGDNSPVGTKDFLDEAEKNKLIIRYAESIRLNKKEKFQAGAKRLDAALKWRKSEIDFAMDVTELAEGNALSMRNRLISSLGSAIKESEKIAPGMSDFNFAYAQGVKDMANKKVGMSGDEQNRPQAYFNALIDTDPFGGGGDNYEYDFRKAENLAAQRELFKWFKEESGRDVFKLDPVTGMITNLDEIKDPKSGEPGGILHGLMSPTRIAQVFRSNTTQLDAYNAYAKNVADTTGAINKRVEGLREDLNRLRDPSTTAAQVVEVAKKAASGLASVEDAAEHDGSFDIGDMDELQDQLKDFEQLDKQTEILEKAQQQLLGSSTKDAANKVRMEMAHAMSSPAYQAWAADHGFDELGRVDVDDDNNILIDTYVQGRDDLASLRAFLREQKRGSGRYGFRSPGTGDMVQFEMDGETITGERLKFHAADRPGVVRIAVPGREPPVITLSPGEVDQIAIISSDPEKSSPLERSARRALRSSRGDLEAARKMSMGDPSLDIGDAAIVDSDFIVDESGRNLSADEYQKMVGDKAASGRVVAKVVDGVTYLVQPSGAVWKLDPESNELLELGQEGADKAELKMLADVADAPERRVARVVNGKAENIDSSDDSFLTMAEEENTFVFEPFEGEENYSAEMVANFDGNESERLAEITPESLGLKRSDDFSGVAGQEYENERNIGGMKYVDLRSPPDRPGAKANDIVEGFAAGQVTTEDPETPSEQVGMSALDRAGITPAQQDVIDDWTAEYKAAPGDAKPPPPEGYEVVKGKGLVPIETDTIEKFEADALEAVGPRGDESVSFDTETPDPEVPDKDTSGLTEKEQETIRMWTTQAREANLKGKPGKPIPEGYEMVHGVGLRPIRRPETLSDEELDALGVLPPEPKPEPEPEPETETEPEPEPEPKPAPAPAPKVKPPLDPEAVSKGMAKIKAKMEKKGGGAVSGTASEEEGKPEVKKEKKKEKNRVKLGDVVNQLMTSKKKRAQQQNKEIEALGGVLGPRVVEDDPPQDEVQDEVQDEGQGRVRGTPTVVGQEAEPKPTPEPKTAEEKEDEVAKLADKLAAMRANKERLNIAAGVDTSGSPVPDVDIGGQ